MEKFFDNTTYFITTGFIPCRFFILLVSNLLGAVEGDVKLGANANNILSSRRGRAEGGLLDSEADQRALSARYSYKNSVLKR